MKLFKCILECKIKGFPNLVEYFRAKNEDQLIIMFEQCENLEGATYYGYKWIEISPIKIINFPEVHTMKIK